MEGIISAYTLKTQKAKRKNEADAENPCASVLFITAGTAAEAVRWKSGRSSAAASRNGKRINYILHLKKSFVKSIPVTAPLK
ncbi:MAG: hypothetical protein NTX59_06030 [Elusimicrobia bacterium]|nr:hypothetical protein [Elusimicrobiota bacterium]